MDVTPPFNFESIVKRRLSSFPDAGVFPRSASMPVAQAAPAQDYYRTTENYKAIPNAIPRAPKAMIASQQTFHQLGAYGTQVYPPRIPEQGNATQGFQRHSQAQVFSQGAQHTGFPMGGPMGSFDMSAAAGFQGQAGLQLGQQFFNFETPSATNLRTVSQPASANQRATQYKDPSPAAHGKEEGSRISSLASSIGPCIGTQVRYGSPPPKMKPLVSAPPSRVNSVKRVPKPGPKAIPIIKPTTIAVGSDDHEFPGLTSLIEKFKDYDFGDPYIMPGYYDPSMISCRRKDDPLYCKPFMRMSDTPFCGTCNEPMTRLRTPGDDHESSEKNDENEEGSIYGLSAFGDDEKDESVAPKDLLAGLTWEMQRDQLTTDFKIHMMKNYPRGTKLSSTQISEVLADLSLDASQKLELLRILAEHVPLNSFDKTLGTPIKPEERRNFKGKWADHVEAQEESVKSKEQAAADATPKATEESPGIPNITIATTTADPAFGNHDSALDLPGRVTENHPEVTPKKHSNIPGAHQPPSVTVTPVPKKTHISTLKTPKRPSFSTDYNSDLTPDSLATLRAFEAEQQQQLHLFSKKLAEDHEAAEKMLRELLPRKDKEGTPVRVARASPRATPRASPLSKVNMGLSKPTTSTPQATRAGQVSQAYRASQLAVLAAIPKPCKELMDTYPKAQWACTSCRVIYSGEQELLKHYEMEEHDWRLWCKWCDTIFDDLERVGRHRCEVYVGEREWREVR
ncbi:Protein of unknown function [Pyronema omphalodes CBS 100304]|uniref:C2H2-type domain-containing protein n=1 Tax=Pyronema omphalodes (strain CBS 100304) TaxID=1076935 RepID=U4KWA4_PYROM|nr:Protein of unknown function [Pyronema omphalodes CBS 100304]